MKNKFLKLPFITVKELESDEVSDKGTGGLELVSNGKKLQMWFDQGNPCYICDIPYGYICDEKETPNIESVMNGQTEWVSGNTLLEIVKTIVNKDSNDKIQPCVLYPPQPIHSVDDKKHDKVDIAKIIEENITLRKYIDIEYDIHGTIEKKLKSNKNSIFKCVSKVVLPSDYDIFLLMSSVS